MISEVDEISDFQADQIAFIGESLAPFYRYDPGINAECLEPLFNAFANMDPAEAAIEWPFVETEEAKSCIAQIQRGLAAGYVGNTEDSSLVRRPRWLLRGGRCI